MPIQNIKRERIIDQIFDSMKEMIINGSWPVGSKIPSEAELAANFGVSKMSVHAALQKLEVLGFVDIRVGSGTYVKINSFGECIKEIGRAVFPPSDANQVAELRKAIELEAVYLAIDRYTPEQLEELRASYRQLHKAYLIGDAQMIKKNDCAFHRCLCAMSDNELFVVQFDMCYGLLEDFFTSAGNLAESKSEKLSADPDTNYWDPHFLLLKAVENHDKAAAAAAYDKMIMNSQLV